MLINNRNRQFSRLGALAVGAMALGLTAVPLTAKAQVYFDAGPVGVGIGPPEPYYYHHNYWRGSPGYFYGRPYGYYGW
jgi:hypothetical protein